MEKKDYEKIVHDMKETLKEIDVIDEKCIKISKTVVPYQAVLKQKKMVYTALYKKWTKDYEEQHKLFYESIQKDTKLPISRLFQMKQTLDEIETKRQQESERFRKTKMMYYNNVKPFFDEKRLLNSLKKEKKEQIFKTIKEC